MLAVVFTPEGRRVEDVPEPVPGPTDVLLQVEYCGICGSDLHAAEPQFHRGTTLGHEFVGTILETGRDVVGFTAGDRVAVNPNGVVCGTCDMCRSGRVNLCPAVWEHSVGVVRNGGLAPYAATDQRTLHHLPEAVSFRHGALTEPLAVALRAVRTSGFSAGETAVVFGGGPIGLLVTALLYAEGAADISVVEPSKVRRERASALGASRTIDPMEGPLEQHFEGPSRPRFAFDFTGVAAVPGQAIAALAPGGVLSVAGWSGGPPTISAEDLVFKEITLRGSFIYTTEFADAIAVLNSSRLDIDSLISGVVPVADAPDAFAAMSSSPEVIKFLISDFH